MFLIFAALIGSGEETVVVKDNTVLELQLQTPIQDYVGMDDSNPFAGLFNVNQGLDDILHAIRIAKEDDRIKGISLKNNILMAGLSQTQAIREALLDFAESGKFIFAFGDYYTQKDIIWPVWPIRCFLILLEPWILRGFLPKSFSLRTCRRSPVLRWR